MFWGKKKKNLYPCKPQFYYIKVGCKGVFVTRTCFRDVSFNGFGSASSQIAEFACSIPGSGRIDVSNR